MRSECSVFAEYATNNDDEPKQFKPLSNKYWKNLINKINGFILIGLYYQKKEDLLLSKESVNMNVV